MSKQRNSQSSPSRRQPWHNLRLYLREATLPNLILHHDAPKLGGSKAPDGTYLLSPEADSRYKLYLINRYKHSVMNRRILEFCDISIPSKVIPNAECIGTYVRSALIGLPAKSFPSITPHIPAPPLDLDDLLQWIMVPLLAAERIVTLTWPEVTKGFAFTTMTKNKLGKLSHDPDLRLYRPVWWKNTNIDEEDVITPSCKLVVLSFLHWTFAPGDVQDFIRTTEFPSARTNFSGNEPRKLSRAEKIWAKLYDECATKNCPLFVLTVYNAWIFGTFTDGFRKAVTSYVINHTDQNPSVMEWLIYWMASAHKIEGSYLRGPRHYENADFTCPEKVTESRSYTIPKNARTEELVMIDKTSGELSMVNIEGRDIRWHWHFNERAGN